MPAGTQQSCGGGGAGAPQLSALLWNCALFNPNGGCHFAGTGKGLSLLPVMFRLGLVGWGGGLSSLQVVGGFLFCFWVFCCCWDHLRCT